MNRLLRDPESGRPAPIMPGRYRQQAGCGTSSGAAMVPATPPRSNTCCRYAFTTLHADAAGGDDGDDDDARPRPRAHPSGAERGVRPRSDSADQELLGIGKRVFPKEMEKKRMLGITVARPAAAAHV